MSERTVIVTEGAPRPFAGAPYNQAVKGAGLVFCAGQVGMAETGFAVAGETVDDRPRDAVARRGDGDARHQFHLRWDRSMRIGDPREDSTLLLAGGATRLSPALRAVLRLPYRASWTAPGGLVRILPYRP